MTGGEGNLISINVRNGRFSKLQCISAMGNSTARSKNETEWYVLTQTHLQDTSVCEKNKVQDSVYGMPPFGYQVHVYACTCLNISGRI